jgi:hypothetical protein
VVDILVVTMRSNGAGWKNAGYVQDGLDFSQQDAARCVKPGSRILRGWDAGFSGDVGLGFCVVAVFHFGFRTRELASGAGLGSRSSWDFVRQKPPGEAALNLRLYVLG